jgi:hypothetical protein
MFSWFSYMNIVGRVETVNGTIPREPIVARLRERNSSPFIGLAARIMFPGVYNLGLFVLLSFARVENVNVTANPK